MFKEELTGDVTFWQQTNSGYGITVVELDGNSANITSEYNSAPDCGASGCAVFNNLVEEVTTTQLVMEMQFGQAQ